MELVEKLKKIIVSDESALLCRKKRWRKSKDTFRRNIYFATSSLSYKYIEHTVWDQKKPICVAIGFNPAEWNVDVTDDTNKKIRIELEKNGYGAYILLNLFPQISTTKSSFGKTDSENQKFEKVLPKLLKKIINSKANVLIFWGREVCVNENIRNCLIKLQQNKKLYITVKSGTTEHYHPSRVSIDIIPAPVNSIVTFASIQ